MARTPKQPPVGPAREETSSPPPVRSPASGFLPLRRASESVSFGALSSDPAKATRGGLSPIDFARVQTPLDAKDVIARCYKLEVAGDILGALNAIQPNSWAAAIAPLLQRELARICEKLLLRLAHTGHGDKTTEGFRLLEEIMVNPFGGEIKEPVSTLRGMCFELAKTLNKYEISYNYDVNTTNNLYTLEEAELKVARDRGFASVAEMDAALGRKATARVKENRAAQEIFGTVPPALRSKAYERGGYPPEMLEDAEAVRAARRIVNARNRRKEVKLTAEETALVRRANRFVRAAERHQRQPG
jgi:hypothetical protein